MANERTPLRQNESVPPYVFITNHNRAYKNKIRRFQCCICAGLLAIFITALVITVSYTVNHDEEDINGTSSIPITATTPSSNAAEDPVLNTLLTLTWPLQDKPYEIWDDPLNETEIEEAISEGKMLLAQKETFEEKVPSLQMNTPSYRHQMVTKTLPEARVLSRTGFIMEGATKRIVNNRWKGKGKPNGRGPKLHVELLPKEVCSESAPNPCSSSPYRSPDGSCNNAKHPRTWGVAMRPFRRIIPPIYADGISAPRKAKDGKHLPSARDVSLTVHRPFYRDDPNFTVMLAVWGQFIDHDITATALSQGKGGSSISCCNGYFQSALVPHPECYTVTLESPDPYYEQYNVSCMEFVRSSPAPMCSFGPREQMNQASSFLDGSVVYGTSKNVMDQLRTFEGGELKMLVTPDGQELLPVSTDPSDGCNQEEQLAQGRYCFLSGDARSNENIHLTSMHLLLARQHNIIARKLAALNPTWDDEKLFQESRKIVAAQIQHVTYNEFLPVVLGPRLMEKLKMSPRNNSYSTTYDPTLDASIANSFASSAFRFGHTLLPGLVRMIAGDNSSDEYVEMHKMLFNPFQLYDKGFLEKSVRGAINTSVEKVDTYFNPEFTQHLFERKPSIGRPKGMCGLDLVSLNVQRGRDHGLPGYPAFREHCGLERPKTIEDLKAYMDEGSWERIKNIYKDVDDIDMYTGALAEIPLTGGLVGPTVTCLVTDQFLRLQRGDRFWYETGEQPQSFTSTQLNEIKKTTLAKIICDTSDVDYTQPMVMRGTKNGNDRVACSELSAVDLQAWKENPRVPINDAPGKIWLIKNSAPKSPKLVKLGGSVSSGSLTINGISVWSGMLPLKIPTRPFDAFVQNTDLPQIPYPPIYGHGVLWSGSITLSDGQASLNGQLSIPQYIVGTNNQKTIAWYNGAFSLNVDTVWNSYEGVPTKLSGQYTTPLFLHSNKSYNPESGTSNDISIDVYPSVEPEQKVNGSLAPLILIGSYSSDRSHFIWNGNLTLAIPSQVAPPATPSNVLQMAYTPKSFVKHIRIGGKVTGGTVTAQGYNIWKGELPLSMPVDPFDTLAEMENTNNDEPIIYGHGINWKGTLISKSPNTAVLTAKFSLPKFVHSNGIAPFSIQWYNGDISLDLETNWWSGSENELNFDGVYTTSVHFGARKFYDDISKDAKSLEGLEIPFAGSPKVYQEGLHTQLVLLGSYSGDGKTFYWSGNVTIVLPKIVHLPLPAPTLTASNLAAKSQTLRVPLRLVGGQVNVGGWNIWYNTLPLGIPLKPLRSVTSVGEDPELSSHQPSFGQSIVWNGTVSIIDSNFVKISGTFSLPKFNNDTKSLTWLKGNFDLQFQSNKTLSINGTYKTSLYFAERIIYNNLRDISMNHVESLSGLGIKEYDLPAIFHRKTESYRKAPIILFGTNSYDKSEFLWSGDCILVLPQLEEVTESVVLAATSSKSNNNVLKLGGTVTTFSVSLEGSNISTNAQAPISFPLNLFDNVISPVATANEPSAYGQGILWKGEILKSVNLQDLAITGKFSVPTVSTDGSLKWYNGEMTFNVDIAWKTFNTSILGTFSSVIILNEKKKSANKLGMSGTSIIEEMSTFNTSSVNLESSGSAPVILGGEYSADRKTFIWSGDITMFIQLNDKSILKAVSGKQTKITAFTNGGSITLDGKSIWVGNRVPLAIPLQPFDSVVRPLSAPIEKLSPQESTIIWNGFIQSGAPSTIKVWGTYSLSTAAASTTNDSLSWYNGDFAFELKLLSEPAETINVQGPHQSILYLNELSSYTNLSPEWNITAAQTSLPGQPITEVTQDAPFIPIILDGTYSSDRKTFIWSGNVTVLLPI